MVFYIARFWATVLELRQQRKVVAKMFERISGFLNTLFADMQTTFITIFMIGLLICAIGVWAGDEQSSPKFKNGLKLCVVGVVLFLLAKPVIDYIQTNL